MTTANAKDIGGFGRSALRAALLCVLVCGSVICSPQSDVDSAGFLVIINEGQMELSRTGVTSSDCILVQPDGRFHLERRKQQMSKMPADLSVFEASLDSEQLASLRTILADKELATLPPYVEPKLPIGGSWFRGVDVHIPREEGIQKVGYFRLPAETPPRSYTAEDVKSWEESALRLRPLLDWFHSVEKQNVTPSSVQSNQCHLGSNAN